MSMTNKSPSAGTQFALEYMHLQNRAQKENLEIQDNGRDSVFLALEGTEKDVATLNAADRLTIAVLPRSASGPDISQPSNLAIKGWGAETRMSNA